MQRENLARLTGLPDTTLDATGSLVVYLDRGEGPELVATATTVSTAIDEILAALFSDGPPDYPEDAPEYGPDDTYAGESELVRALGYELGEQQGVVRTFATAGLSHLAGVLRDPSLELVVAWEAVAPAPDFAVGIFRRSAT